MVITFRGWFGVIKRPLHYMGDLRRYRRWDHAKTKRMELKVKYHPPKGVKLSCRVVSNWKGKLAPFGFTGVVRLLWKKRKENGDLD